MKLKHLFLFLFLALLVIGGFWLFSSPEGQDASIITIGGSLTVDNTDGGMTLLSNLDALAADGLYYAAWGMGSKESYENEDGKNVDLYDAQIYVLLGECQDSDAAQNYIDTWLAAGKSNYEVLSEEKATYHGQSYSKLIYRLKNKDNPFAHGISVFTVSGNNAVCMELVCREKLEEDPETLLSGFLNCCTYTAK